MGHVRKPLTFGTLLLLVLSAYCVNVFGKGKPGGDGSTSMPSYDIVMLTDGVENMAAVGVGDINQRGEIVGWVGGADSQANAALWTVTITDSEVQTSLTLLPSEAPSAAAGINGLGEVVGSANGHGRYWSGVQSVPLDLPPLSGHDRSSALRISNHGVVCGYSEDVADPIGSVRAVAWRINVNPETHGLWVWGPIELPTFADPAIARSLTDSDENGYAKIVGGLETTPGTALLWTVQSQADGSLAVAPIPEFLDTNAVARSINAKNVICGNRWPPDDNAVVWTDQGATILSSDANVVDAKANDLNIDNLIVGTGYFRRGSIVGFRAVAWFGIEASMMPLGSFLKPKSQFSRLDSAEAVSDLGVIIGNGRNSSGEPRAFVAIPSY